MIHHLHNTYATVPGGHAKVEKLASTSLPSFNELLTSIPLPNEFRSRQSSSTSDNGVVSPQQQNNYISVIPYAQTTPRSRMVQVSPASFGHISPHPPQQFVQPYGAYSYQACVPQAFNSPWTFTGFPGGPQVIAASLGSPTILNGNEDFEKKLRSYSTSDLIISGNGVIIKDPKRKHICKVCSRTFTTSGHLARHGRIHTGERKHVCPWPTCDTRFSRQDNCMQHYKTHTNGKNKRSKTGKLSSKSFT
ncbi:Transcriptional regulator NRG1 [Spathaspora sp. JA1]|nr:Transcriptional regulator NRG1 [Spathaspora sp. JA1]